MQITIIYKCDDIRVHRADCADVKKDSRGATTVYSMEATTTHEVANDFYSDFISEGSMTEDEALQYADFLPCCNQLTGARR